MRNFVRQVATDRADEEVYSFHFFGRPHISPRLANRSCQWRSLSILFTLLGGLTSVLDLQWTTKTLLVDNTASENRFVSNANFQFVNMCIRSTSNRTSLNESLFKSCSDLHHGLSCTCIVSCCFLSVHSWVIREQLVAVKSVDLSWHEFEWV